MGGFSSEREISLQSGTAVAEALKSMGHDVVIFDFQSIEELVGKLQAGGVDCVFNALHGRFGEDGQVQKILDGLRIPYTGSGVRASQLAMNKVASRRIFQDNGLRVPRYQVVHKNDLYPQINVAEFPVVVKPAHEGSSIGQSIVDDINALPSAVESAACFDETIIVEQYIPGREITVGILDGRPLPVIEVVPKNKFYDFQAKYTKGMTEYKVPADMPEDVKGKVQGAAIKAHRLLGCRCFSRVDMILDAKNRPVVLEVNTIPGLTSTSLLPKAAAAVGIGFSQLCSIMVHAAVNKHYAEALAES